MVAVAVEELLEPCTRQRRIRIDHGGLAGWVSVATQANEPMLEPCQQHHSEIIAKTFTVADALAGSIIGSGGSTVTAIRGTSGASVSLSPFSSSFSDRTVKVTGTSPQILAAEQLIEKSIGEKSIGIQDRVDWMRAVEQATSSSISTTGTLDARHLATAIQPLASNEAAIFDSARADTITVEAERRVRSELINESLSSMSLVHIDSVISSAEKWETNAMNLGAQLRALKMHRVQLSGFIHHFSVGRRAVLCGFGWVTILGLPSDSDSVFYTVAQEVLSESQPLPLPCRDTWLTPEEQVIARSSSATMVSTSDAALALTLRVQITTAALSPQVTTDDLRSLFSKCGQITGITCRLGSQRFHNETALLPLGGQGFEHIATNQYSTPTRRRGRGVAELRTCEALVAFDDSIGLHTALIAFHGVQKPNPQALAGWGAQKTYNLSMHVSISAVPADGKECTRVKLQRPPQLWYDPSGEDKILQFVAPCGKIKNVFLSVFSIKVTFDTAEAALNAVRMNGETHVLGLATPSGVARESSRASFGNIAPSLGLTWLIPHSIGSPNEGPPKPRTVWISGLPRHWTRQSCIDAFAAAGLFYTRRFLTPGAALLSSSSTSMFSCRLPHLQTLVLIPGQCQLMK